MKAKGIAKNIAAISLLAVFGLVATGCGKKPTTSTQPIKLRVWRVDQDVDPLRDTFKAFKKENSTAQVSYKKNSLDGYEVAALTSLAGRQGPDIWSIPNDWLGDYPNQTLPLPDTFFAQANVKDTPKPEVAIKDLFPEGIATALIRPDGKVYGMPTNVDTLRLYYNPALFDAAEDDFKKSLGNNRTDAVLQPVRTLLDKPPATWNDLVSQTRYITQRDGNTVTRSTIALGAADNIPDGQDILQLLMMQNGASIVSNDHTRALFHTTQTTPSGSVLRPGEQALEFFRSFSDPSKQTYSWNPSMPQAIDAFGQGKVAMVIAYSDFGKDLDIKYPKLKWEETVVPQVSAATTQTPVNIAKFYVETVTQTADRPSAAFGFMKAYTNKSLAKTLAREEKKVTPYTKDLETSTRPIEKQILTAKTVYKKNHTTFDRIWYQMIRDVSQNGIAPAQALDTAAEKINELLVPKKDTNETTF